jgi:hypothetical protein
MDDQIDVQSRQIELMATQIGELKAKLAEKEIRTKEKTLEEVTELICLAKTNEQSRWANNFHYMITQLPAGKEKLYEFIHRMTKERALFFRGASLSLQAKEKSSLLDAGLISEEEAAGLRFESANRSNNRSNKRYRNNQETSYNKKK